MAGAGKSNGMRLYRTIAKDGTGRAYLRMSCLRDIVLCALESIVVVDPYDAGYFDFTPQDCAIGLRGGTWDITLGVMVSRYSDVPAIESAIAAETKEAIALTLPELRYRLLLSFTRIG